MKFAYLFYNADLVQQKGIVCASSEEEAKTILINDRVNYTALWEVKEIHNSQPSMRRKWGNYRGFRG